jgi:cbb3-type cytochrome oxidase subunit 1
MDWPVRSFLRSSLSWLALGVTLGLAMALRPAWTIYRPAHEHMNMLGFVTMMIYGVAYHVLPRFSGNPLRHPRLAIWHVWVANAGLALMVLGFIARAHVTLVAMGTGLLATGGSLSALGAYAFALNIWRTIPASRRVPLTRPS